MSFMQAGQFIGSRADFVPEPICKKLSLLCDKVRDRLKTTPLLLSCGVEEGGLISFHQVEPTDMHAAVAIPIMK